MSRALEVSRCSHAKQRQKNVQKSVLHVQSFLGGPIRSIGVFDRSSCFRRLALQDFIFYLSKLQIY